MANKEEGPIEELCLNHRRKHGLIATPQAAFDLACVIQCEVELTCPLR